MSEQPKRMALNVLPHSGKVDKLKEEFRLSQAPHNPPPGATPPAADPAAAPTTLKDKIIAVLRTIYDPEIPVNIYDLGLIYAIDILPENRVEMRMTLTAPGCPVAGELVAKVESSVQSIPEVSSASVELVWDPPWNQHMMSEEAKLELGFF